MFKFALNSLVTCYVKIQLLLLEVQNHRYSFNEIMINILVGLLLLSFVLLSKLLSQVDCRN